MSRGKNKRKAAMRRRRSRLPGYDFWTEPVALTEEDVQRMRDEGWNFVGVGIVHEFAPGEMTRLSDWLDHEFNLGSTKTPPPPDLDPYRVVYYGLPQPFVKV